MPGIVKAKKKKKSTSMNPFQKIANALDKANVTGAGAGPKLKTDLGADSTEAQQRRKKRLAAFARRMQRSK